MVCSRSCPDRCLLLFFTLPMELLLRMPPRQVDSAVLSVSVQNWRRLIRQLSLIKKNCLKAQLEALVLLWKWVPLEIEFRCRVLAGFHRDGQSLLPRCR